MRLHRAVFALERFDAHGSTKRQQGMRGLYLVLSGQLLLSGPTGVNDLSSGDLALLPARSPHERHSALQGRRGGPCELLSASLEFYAAPSRGVSARS